MCYNPNPHEIDFGDDLAEIAKNPRFAKKQHLVTRKQQGNLAAKVRTFLASPPVQSLSPTDKAELKKRIQALFNRINPNVVVR